MNNSKPYHFKPIDIAKMTGASVQTVRRWTDLFAAVLSESANSLPGEPRLYTWADVEMIKQIKALRDQNVPVELIPDRLSRPTTSPSTVIQEIALPDDQESQHITPAPIVGQEYLVAIERRLEAVEASRKDYVQGIATGILLALGFVVVILLLALIYGK